MRDGIDFGLIDPKTCFGDGRDTPPIFGQLENLEKNGHEAVVGEYLSAEGPANGNPNANRFKARIPHVGMPSAEQQVGLQGFHGGFEAERSGLNGVRKEMSLEKPVFGIDVLLRAQDAEMSA